MIIERATVADVPRIAALIDTYAKSMDMLPRTLNDIYSNLLSYVVARDDDLPVCACVGVRPFWGGNDGDVVAEIQSLAVRPHLRLKGYGEALVKHVEIVMAHKGVKSMFALTKIPDYFVKLGYEKASREQLPGRKIWAECIQCDRFPDCDEVPVIKKLRTPEASDVVD